MDDIKAINRVRLLRYRLVPERPAFNTSSSYSEHSNTMTVGDQRIEDSLPDGASGGFQAAQIDPTDFTIRHRAAFSINSNTDDAGPLGGRKELVEFVKQNPGKHPALIMQSIGRVGAAARPRTQTHASGEAHLRVRDASRAGEHPPRRLPPASGI